jgi:serine acetyltransferase
VIHGITVGRDAIVGAGSTVIHNVGDSLTVIGSPARVSGFQE